jgi:hypothetical protein
VVFSLSFQQGFPWFQYLNSFVLEPEPVEGLDGLIGVVHVVVVDEPVAETLTCDNGTKFFYVHTNSGASDFCHVWLILPGWLSDFARLSDQFWDRNLPISPSNFVQCDVHRLDAYKNKTYGLVKLVGQQKSDQFWIFRVNDP